MGFRFQRSLRIAKGLRLNVSKSGLGVSLGPRGAKISVGPRGIYTNAGIFGTGLSMRNKIGGGHLRGNQGFLSLFSGSSGKVIIKASVLVDEESGKEHITLSANGREITDESLLRKVKRDPDLKAEIQKIRNKAYLKSQHEAETVIDIYQHSESLPDWQNISDKVKQSKPDVYRRKESFQNEPKKDDTYFDLLLEANRNVHGFFGMKKKRKQYVDERLEKRYAEALQKWQEEKVSFEKEEDEREAVENVRLKQRYEKWKSEMDQLLNPTKAYLEKRLTDLFSGIRLPVEFAIAFEVRNNCKLVVLDVDLPEIEDYPSKKTSLLVSGKLSIKEKTKKEKKQDYLRSISGISLYFASIVFTAASVIDMVVVSGYTQRINRATGNEEDVYVYSVRYNKEKFKNINFKEIDPILTLQDFEHRMKLTKTFELKKIEPFA